MPCRYCSQGQTWTTPLSFSKSTTAALTRGTVPHGSANCESLRADGALDNLGASKSAETHPPYRQIPARSAQDLAVGPESARVGRHGPFTTLRNPLLDHRRPMVPSTYQRLCDMAWRSAVRSPPRGNGSLYGLLPADPDSLSLCSPGLK